MWRLLYHPESDCLFWHEACIALPDTPDTALLVEVCEAPHADRKTAQNAWALYSRQPSEFDAVYKGRDDEKSSELDEADNSKRAPEQWLEPPRWPGGPPICGYENLPALPSEAELKRFMQNGCDDSSSVVQGYWLCPRCCMWHAKVVGGKCRSGTGSVNDRYVDYFEVSAEREGLIPRFKPSDDFGPGRKKAVDLSRYARKYPRERKSISLELPEQVVPATETLKRTAPVRRGGELW